MKRRILEEYFRTQVGNENEWEKCLTLETLFDSISECVTIYKVVEEGNDFIILDINSAAELTENIQRKEVIGKSAVDVIPGIKELGLLDVFREVYLTGKSKEYPVKLIKNERIKAGWRENYVFKIPEDDIIVAIYEDVSKLKKTEESLRESEEKFKILFENTPVGYQSLDDDANILEINHTWLKILGYNKTEVIGSWFGEFLPIDEIEKFKTLFKDFKINGNINNEELKMKKKDGDIIIVSLTGKIRYDSNGKINQTHTILEDITENKKNLDEIKYISKFAEEDPSPVLRVNSDNIILYANPGSKVLMDFWRVKKDHKIPEMYHQKIQMALSRAKQTQIDVKCNDLYYSLVIAPVADEHYVNIYGRDITLRRKYEEHLSKTNRMYSFLSQMNQLIIRTQSRDELLENICDIAVHYGKFRFAWIGLVDNAEQKIIPYKFAGIEAGYLKNLFISTRDDIPEGKGPTGRAVREGKCITANNILDEPTYTPWRHEAIERGYLSAASVPFYLEEEVLGVLCFFASEKDFFDKEEIRLVEEISSDITYAIKQLALNEENEAITEELIKSEESFRLMTEVSPFPISLFNTSNNFFYINPEFTKTFGYTLEDIPTMEKWFELAYPDPEYRNFVYLEWSKIDDMRNEKEPILFNVKCKNGMTKTILFHYYPLDKERSLLYYLDVTIIPWQIPLQ